MSQGTQSLLEQLENISRMESNNTFWRKKKILIRLTIILLCFALIIIISYIIVLSSKNSNNLSDYKKYKNNPDGPHKIYVDLSGAVNKPGVYEVKPETRLFMLIEKAGGLSIDADREFIARNYNLSVPMSDQQKIYVPTTYDVLDGLVIEKQKIVVTELDQLTNSSSVISNEPFTNRKSLSSSSISINTDDLTTLMSLPGVGEVTAQRIIAARPYDSIDSLVEKGIIKESLLQKIRDKLAL